MPFPKITKVNYLQTPLVQVICQLRFPPILKIDSQIADYQDIIRSEYPHYKKRTAGFPIDPIKDQLPPQLTEFFDNKQLVHDFISEDGRWLTSLSKGFISLETKMYLGWDEFQQRFNGLLETLEEQFRPSFFSRVGLRYKNIIHRSKLGLDRTTAWNELLSSNILNELSVLDESCVVHINHNIEIRLSDQRSLVRIAHGFVETADNTEEICYLIDSDFFTNQKVARDDAIDRINYFNERAGRLFRWCISDTLHSTLEPTDKLP